MEIKEIMELEVGEKDELVKLLEAYHTGQGSPESVVSYINKLLTGAFNQGRKYGAKK